jgi:hypothetical protein
MEYDDRIHDLDELELGTRAFMRATAETLAGILTRDGCSPTLMGDLLNARAAERGWSERRANLRLVTS